MFEPIENNEVNQKSDWYKLAAKLHEFEPMSRMDLPKYPNMAGVDLVPSDVDAVIALFDLHWPVKIRFVASKNMHGKHIWKGYYHQIHIKTRLNAKDVSRTLYHELCHAAQCERFGGKEFQARYKNEKKKNGYKNNPFEVEAREYEQLADHKLLAEKVNEGRSYDESGRYVQL